MSERMLEMSKENQQKKRHKDAIKYGRMMSALHEYDLETKKVRKRFERKPYSWCENARV